MVTLADILNFQFPTAPRRGFVVSDDGDGIQYLSLWDTTKMGRAAPSQAEIDSWRPAAQAAADAAAAEESSNQTNLNDLIAQAVAAVQGNTDYLAIVTPTNAQVVAQVRALTQQMNRVIRAIVWLLKRFR